MIQRIQSLYLVVAMILLSLLYFFPFATLNLRGVEVAISVTGLHSEFAYAGIQFWFYIFTAILSILILMLAYIVFAYKNRRRQIKFSAFALLVNVLLIGLLFYGCDMMAASMEPGLENASRLIAYKWPLGLVLISAVLIILANRAIRKDEALVRSAERFR